MMKVLVILVAAACVVLVPRMVLAEEAKPVKTTYVEIDPKDVLGERNEPGIVDVPGSAPAVKFPPFHKVRKNFEKETMKTVDNLQ